MRKSDEIRSPTSCLNKANLDEFIFVLLGRDRAAPHAIRAWVAKRVELGLNKYDDEQIVDALGIAEAMTMEYNKKVTKLKSS